MVRKSGRRGFLKGVVGSCVAGIAIPEYVPSSVLGADGGVAASNRITMASIGVGGKRPGGQGTYDLQEFLGREQVRVAAVCDVDATHRGRARDMVNSKYGNSDCRMYNDFRELLERGDIDAVAIVVPDHWHAIIAISAARAGKDIFSQKPLAYTVAEGRAICDAVERYGTVWQTGNSLRSSRNVRRACELVRNGRIGKLHTVKVGLHNNNHIGDNGDAIRTITEPTKPPAELDYDMWLGPAPYKPYCPGRCHWNFRWISDYSGGQITDWAGHYCDVAQWGMGTELTGPVSVEGGGVFPTGPLYDTVEDYSFTCIYANGLKMTVSGKNTDGIRFEGSQGWLHVSHAAMDAEPKGVLDSAIGPDEIHLYESNDHKGNFLECIKSRRPCVSPAQIAQRSITVGHLGVAAIKLGRKLQFDPETERFVDDAEADRLLRRPMRGDWRV